ncbi:glutamate 5-kinase [Ileibacterium valens]|uniref:glutamate 5-kinase n=2 Tax=Ileibacterium valens TaxID=1862668 RepID=UPI0034E397AD
MLQATVMRRDQITNHQRIVIKVGSSSLMHPETGQPDFARIELLVRELANLQNWGKEVILVSSGAIMVGRQALGLESRPDTIAMKQACASIGQSRLMMLYQKLFSEYNQICSQILMTKHTIVRRTSRRNAKNTFEQLLKMRVIPIVNENDTISTHEIEFGDNDSLSAVVAALTNADLLIILSDIDGLYTDDPRKNPEAKFISHVEVIDETIMALGKGTSSDVGTGGMSTKINAASLASSFGCDTIIANASDFRIIHRLIAGEEEGTFFTNHPSKGMTLEQFLGDLSD